MKIDLWYGDVPDLVQNYIEQFGLFPKNKPGTLAQANREMNAGLRELEYLAFKSPPCKLCKYKDEEPTFRLCCDCVESEKGWSSFVQKD